MSDESHSRRLDEGFTLIEVLIAMIVLGIGVAALMTAFGTQIKTSLTNRNQSEAEALLTAAAEYVKSLPYPASCTPIGGKTLAASGPELPHDTAFTIKYGPGTLFDGATDFCSIQQVPLTVDGQGYHLSLNVIRRPAVKSS